MLATDRRVQKASARLWRDSEHRAFLFDERFADSERGAAERFIDGMLRLADQKSGSPSPTQIAGVFMALAYVSRHPAITRHTIRDLAAAAGVSSPVFRKWLHRVAGFTGLRDPHAKSCEHNRNVSVALLRRKSK